ncbi:unnamed protein product [Somion occarium]|uniref:AAA+ ATPase domain-containing protein n=1 Tax=Somion occarium TaxID=3059160 RepID=A0ABP1CY73_9APHY
MSEPKKKAGAKRGRKPKANSSAQRTLKDMFGNQASSSAASLTSVPSGAEVVDVDAQAAGERSDNYGASGAQVHTDESNTVKRNEVSAASDKRMPIYPMFLKRQAPSESSRNTGPPTQAENDEVIEILAEGSDVETKRAPPTQFQRAPLRPIPITRRDSTPGQSREDPIVVEMSPERPTTAKTSSKAVWSIFQPSDSRPSSPTKQQFKKASQGCLQLPYPTKDTQHVRGPQVAFEGPASPFPQREKGKERAREIETELPVFLRAFQKLKTDHHDASANSDAAHVVRSSVPNLALPDNIPRAYRAYPAIARLSNEAFLQDINRQGSRNLQWTEKWRPRRADEVLGNEQRALYLRDWLVALRLQFDKHGQPEAEASSQRRKRKLAKSKKPQIIRQVRKRRRIDYDDLDGFVAPDDEFEEFEDTMYESEDDLTHFSTSQVSSPVPSTDSSPPSPFPSSPPPEELDDGFCPTFSLRPVHFGQTLHNTILLTGPSGCGKTAAVYACAEELGWEVFEVYPGIGERNGPELHKLIGDVGKNHLVNAKRNNPISTPSFFQNNGIKRRKQVILSDDEEQGHIDVEQHLEPAPAAPEPSISQSLLLIEEVDVLYQSDAGFWPALINIIKECRRPVILTCNDSSLVPLADLPLQTTLVFEPPPSAIAASYFQAICQIEGILIRHDSLEMLYEGESLRSPLGSSQYPTGRHDLRRTINQLQLGHLQDHVSLTEAEQPQTDEPPAPDDKLIARLSLLHDICSVLDCLTRDDILGTGDTETLDESPSADDELGYKVLRLGSATVRQPVVSVFHDKATAIVDEAAMISRSLLSAFNAPIPLEPLNSADQSLPAERTTFAAELTSVFETCNLPMSILGQPPLYLDYAPWIRYMVGVDDAAIQKLASPSGQVGRQTRNSQKAVSERRYLDHFKERELHVLAVTAFRMDE